MRLHEVGPLAVMPSSIRGLPRDDREQDLSLEQSVERLAGGEFEPQQCDIDRIGLVFGASLPLAAPLETILVNLAVDKIAVHVRRPAESSVRTPHEYGLHLEHERSLQRRDEIRCVGPQAPEHAVEVRIVRYF